MIFELCSGTSTVAMAWASTARGLGGVSFAVNTWSLTSHNRVYGQYRYAKESVEAYLLYQEWIIINENATVRGLGRTGLAQMRVTHITHANLFQIES